MYTVEQHKYLDQKVKHRMLFSVLMLMALMVVQSSPEAQPPDDASIVASSVSSNGDFTIGSRNLDAEVSVTAVKSDEAIFEQDSRMRAERGGVLPTGPEEGSAGGPENPAFEKGDVQRRAVLRLLQN